jgi:hypothetical protein
MAAIALWRWVLLGLLTNPAMGVIWLLLVGLPLLQTLAFLSSSWDAHEVALEWSFPAGLVGASSGLVILARGRPFLARFPAGMRFAGELGGVVLASLYLQVPILAGLLAAGAGLRDLASALPVILTTDLHLAGIALLLLLTSLSTPLSAGLFLAAAWLFPALCAGNSALARASVWLDAAAPLRAGSDGLPSTLVPAATLVLAAHLLRTRPSPSPAG